MVWALQHKNLLKSKTAFRNVDLAPQVASEKIQQCSSGSASNTKKTMLFLGDLITNTNLDKNKQQHLLMTWFIICFKFEMGGWSSENQGTKISMDSFEGWSETKQWTSNLRDNLISRIHCLWMCSCHHDTKKSFKKRYMIKPKLYRQWPIYVSK